MKVQVYGNEKFERLLKAYEDCRGSTAGELIDNPDRTIEWLIEDTVCRHICPMELREQAVKTAFLGFRKCIEEGKTLLYRNILGDYKIITFQVKGETKIGKDSVILPHLGKVSLVNPNNDSGTKTLQQVTVFKDEDGLFWIYYEE